MNATDVLKDTAHTIELHRLIQKGDTVVVGVSGGPDSLCLLHILTQLRPEQNLILHVGHLHHGIRGDEADADADFVAALAQSWGLPVTIERCNVPALATRQKQAIEEAARQARYAFLGRLAIRTGASAIAVGHNADDQTETVLMHWLRGAGLAGLRGMLPSTPLAGLRIYQPDEHLFSATNIKIIRPLLEIPRRDIEAYCAEHGLQPRFDRSNLDTTYLRNRLRHELIPLLETYNPNFRKITRRSARIITDDYALLKTLSAAAWAKVVTAESGQAITFDLHAWRELAVSLQRSVVREAIHRLRHSLRNINWIHVENAIVALRDRPVGTRVTLPRGLMLTISYDHFLIADTGYVECAPEYPQLVEDVMPVAVPGITPLPSSDWQLEAHIVPREAYREEHLGNPDPWQAFLDCDSTGKTLVLRCRQPGDHFQPLGLGGHQQKVRDFMINAKIPQPLRNRLPLLASPENIVWIPGWRIDMRTSVTDSTRHILHLVLHRIPKEKAFS